MQSSHGRPDKFVARVLPALLTLLITLLTAIPNHVIGNGDMTPAFTLICIFYWCVYLPGVLPYIFLFVLGIMHDALSSLPLGVSSFIYLGLAYLLHSQRRLMGRALFGAVWVSFIILVALASIMQWGLMCIYTGRTFPIDGPFMRWLVTCIAYPPTHLLLTQVYKRIKER